MMPRAELSPERLAPGPAAGGKQRGEPLHLALRPVKPLVPWKSQADIAGINPTPWRQRLASLRRLKEDDRLAV